MAEEFHHTPIWGKELNLSRAGPCYHHQTVTQFSSLILPHQQKAGVQHRQDFIPFIYLRQYF